MITHYGYIYFSPEADPRQDRYVSQTGDMTTTIVAVPDVSLAPAVARELVENGVQLLELCGIFGPVGTASVLAAIEHRVPVGFVTFGVESISPLAGLIAR